MSAKDRAFLDYLQTKPCLICGQHPACGHHIKTKGSGGPDEPWNLVPLCDQHHKEVHQGLVAFSNKYYRFKAYLDYWRWQFLENDNKKVYKIIPPKGVFK